VIRSHRSFPEGARLLEVLAGECELPLSPEQCTDMVLERCGEIRACSCAQDGGTRGPGKRVADLVPALLVADHPDQQGARLRRDLVMPARLGLFGRSVKDLLRAFEVGYLVTQRALKVECFGVNR